MAACGRCKTRGGQLITFTYDTLNRLATKAAPSEPTVTYTYDLAGRLTAASDTSAAMTAAASPAGTLGTVTMTYDQAAMLDWYAFGPGPNDVPAGSPMGKDQVTMSFGPTPAGALQSMAGLLRRGDARDRLSGRGQPCLDR